jgi:hypothetical protein
MVQNLNSYFGSFQSFDAHASHTCFGNSCGLPCTEILLLTSKLAAVTFKEFAMNFMRELVVAATITITITTNGFENTSAAMAICACLLVNTHGHSIIKCSHKTVTKGRRGHWLTESSELMLKFQGHHPAYC